MASRPKKPSERGGRYAKTEFGPEHRAAARAIFESKPGVTCNEIAHEMGVHEGTLRRWKSDAAKAGHPWRAAKHMPPALSGRAGELANSFKVRATELGPEVSAEQEHAIAEEVAEMNAIQVRAEVLRRHRVEWSAPRKIAYEAMKEESLDKARLAKVMAETITMIQAGETRAYGLDRASRGGDAEGTVVVIERQAAPAGDADG